MDPQWALITGASAGLGKEFARQLAAAGKNLVLVARRTEPMEDLAHVLANTYDVEVRFFQADLSNPAAPSDIFELIQEQELKIDYLINNAGSNGPDLLGDVDWQAQRKYLELMMTSVAGLCHFFIPPMRNRGFGRVINVASVAGLISAAGDYSYGPTKAYLVALSKGLSATIHDEDVHVLALCPGFTHTDFHDSPELTRMKARTPAFIWYDADVVVREGLRAVERRKAVHTSGRLYRFLIPVLQSFLGRWLLPLFGVVEKR